VHQVRDRLNPKATTAKVALDLRDHDESLAHVNFLFKDYKCARWCVGTLAIQRRRPRNHVPTTLNIIH